MQRPGKQRQREVSSESDGRVQRGGRIAEEEAAPPADAFHQPAAAGARGHFPEEPLPGHEHAGGDSRVDEPHGGARKGMVQKPPGQVEEAGAQPAGGALQERLRRPVQRTHAAVRRRVLGILLQQLGHQEPGQQPAVGQELPLLQLHERQPALLPAHVFAAGLHLIHEHGVLHGARGGRVRRARRGPQQPERAGGGAELGLARRRLPVRHKRQPLHVQRHVQLQPGQPAAQGQAARQLRHLPGRAEPCIQPEPVPVRGRPACMKTLPLTPPYPLKNNNKNNNNPFHPQKSLITHPSIPLPCPGPPHASAPALPRPTNISLFCPCALSLTLKNRQNEDKRKTGYLATMFCLFFCFVYV